MLSTPSKDIGEKALATAIANPYLARLELSKMDAEERLIDYCAQGWHVLEPRRAFKKGWAIEQTCEHLEWVTYGQIRRLLINVPPGFMKSMLVNVFWPTWEWGPRAMPSLRYVHASYTDALTLRDNIKSRRLVKSPWYRERWGHLFDISTDQDAKGKFENTMTGWKLATSIGGVGTGERGDRGIVDDPHKVKQAESEAKLEDAIQWFAEEWPTRINDPDESAQLVIMQRLNELDVSGHIISANLGYHHLMIPMEFEVERTCYTVVVPPWLKLTNFQEVKHEDGTIEVVPPQSKEPPTRWTKLESGETITREMYDNPWEMEKELREAVERADMSGTLRWQDGYKADPRVEDGEIAWPERFSKRHIEEELKPQLRMVGGTYAEAGQLQQRPTPRGGGMFKRVWFQKIQAHELPPGRRKARGWDLAGTKKKTSAFTASVLVSRAGRNIFIENVFAFRGTPAEVDEKIKFFAEQDGSGVTQDFPQDPGQAGVAQKQHIAGILQQFLTDVRFTTETGEKEMRARPLAAQAEALNVYIVVGPWNEAFLAEAEVFPKGRFKDRIDAASRAYARLLRMGEDDMPSAPVSIGGSGGGGGDIGQFIGSVAGSFTLDDDVMALI